MMDKFSIKFLSNNIRVSCYSMVLKFKVNLIVTKEIMALIKRDPKSKGKEYKTHYDSLYDVLSYLSRYTIPLTKYRIASNKHIILSLLSNELIHRVTDKNLLLNSDYIDVPHYVISPKGIEYIKRYESLKQLFV
jgi:hypothetical protein